MKKKIYAYRIKITDGGNISFLVRTTAGKVLYYSSHETPLALSNLVREKAAELRFALEDAYDVKAAHNALSAVLDLQWKNNTNAKPKTEVLP